MKAFEANDCVSDAGPVCRLNGGIEEVFKGGFDEIHLVDVLAGFEMLAFHLTAIILVGKGWVINVWAGNDRVNPEGVGVHGVDSGRCDHAKPSVLPPPLLEEIAAALC